MGINYNFVTPQTKDTKDNHKECDLYRYIVACCSENSLIAWVDNTTSKNPANELVETIKELEFCY